MGDRKLREFLTQGQYFLREIKGYLFTLKGKRHEKRFKRAAVKW